MFDPFSVEEYLVPKELGRIDPNASDDYSDDASYLWFHRDSLQFDELYNGLRNIIFMWVA